MQRDGQRVALLKSDRDGRYATAAVVSHDGDSLACYAVPSLGAFRTQARIPFPPQPRDLLPAGARRSVHITPGAPQHPHPWPRPLSLHPPAILHANPYPPQTPTPLRTLPHQRRAQLGEEAYGRLTVLAVDEGQFFGDLASFCAHAADVDGKHVLVAGLDGDFRRERCVFEGVEGEGAAGARAALPWGPLVRPPPPSFPALPGPQPFAIPPPKPPTQTHT